MKLVKLNKSKRPKPVIKRKKIPTNLKILKLVKSGIKHDNLLKGVDAKGNIVSQLGNLRDTSSSNVFENASLLQNMASTIDFNRNAIANMNKEKIALRDQSRKEIESYRKVDEEYKKLEAGIIDRDKKTSAKKECERALKSLKIDNEKSLEEMRKVNRDLYFVESELDVSKEAQVSHHEFLTDIDDREYDLWQQNLRNEKHNKELEIL
jgi:hypothetical protein